jgi:hypothetical protein
LNFNLHILPLITAAITVCHMQNSWRDCPMLQGHARIVVGLTTTYAIIAYHHWCCEYKSRLGWGVQPYVIKISVTCDSSVVFSGRGEQHATKMATT